MKANEKAFDGVLGYKKEKEELMRIGDMLKNREKYEKAGVKIPKGLLICGHKGCGKTLMAKAFAERFGFSVINCEKPDEDDIGPMREVFEKAAGTPDTIVYFENLDMYGPGHPYEKVADIYMMLIALFDFHKDDNLFVVATVNDIRHLPETLLEKGRFDKTVMMSPMLGKNTIEITKEFLKNYKLSDDADAESIAKLVDGSTCFMLEELMQEALELSCYDGSDVITTEHIKKAAIKKIFERQPIDMATSDDDSEYIGLENDVFDLKRTAVHEAGHAVVSEILKPGSVAFVSIYPLEDTTGGFTKYYNEITGDGILFRNIHGIRCMAGAAAEKTIYESTQGGELEDINTAFNIATDLITLNCEKGYDYHFNQFSSSEQLTAKREEAISTKVLHFENLAKVYISKNRDFFNRLVDALLEKGMLMSSEIAEIREG